MLVCVCEFLEAGLQDKRGADHVLLCVAVLCPGVCVRPLQYREESEQS